MKKKKVLKTHIYSFRFIARIFVLNIPTLLVLSFLLIQGEMSFLSALVVSVFATGVVSIVTLFVFKEFENLAAYLKNLAQGGDPEVPRIRRGLFSPFRLLDSFLIIKNLWSEQTLSDASILENLPNPLLMIRPDGKVVWANQIGRDFFGEALIGQTLASFFNDTLFSKTVTDVLEDRTTAEWFELTYGDDAVPYTFQVRIHRLPAKTKDGATAVIVMHDITPFKLFKQQQSDFFANASHELKTPLSILSGVIETLQGPAKNDAVARDKFLTMMSEQTTRMTHLVKDLLLLSKLQMTPEKSVTDIILIPDLLKTIVADLKIKADTHHKTLCLDIVHDLPRFIGNQQELRQAFQNLIDNALKYGAETSCVTVRAELANGFPKKTNKTGITASQTIAISVHNVGNPIPPKKIHRLFERFYRIDSLKNRQIEGTGLGLGIVQQIILKHDGMIDIKSSAEKGTTFTVYLPLEF